MTELATPTLFEKRYMPGYTGHVPSKNERFGGTAGNIQREILTDKGIHPVNFKPSISALSRLYCDNATPKVNKNKETFGNLSRFAPNWTCGPKHMIRQHRVPGYTGHVKGLISENLHSQTFGHTTAMALTKTHPIGHDISPKDKFNSQFHSSYKSKHFRRFVERPDMQTFKDYEDYSEFINEVNLD